MRKQRAFLVQNWVNLLTLSVCFLSFLIFLITKLGKEQYKFIHQSILEWCLFHKTWININDRDLCKTLLSDLIKLENEYQVEKNSIES